MELQIELWPTDRPKDYPANARKWSKNAIEKVAMSLREYGFRQPLVVDSEGVLVIGHLRRAAARHLKLETVPVHVARDLSPAKIKGLRLADNRTHEEATWDEDLLAIEFGELKALNFDLSFTGFDTRQVDSYVGMLAGQTDADDVPETPEAPVTVAGDVWILGDHRLLCGDSSKDESYQKLMAGRQADMCFTDPPYNVAYEGKTEDKLTIQNDAMGAEFFPFLLSVFKNILANTNGAVYACMSSSELHTLFRAFTEAGGHWSTFVIWAKNHFTMGRSDYHRQYEPILYGWREGGKHFWCGARDVGDVWNIDRPSRSTEHPTMKPVELVERAICNSSMRGSVVLDPFGGSGTTAIACEKAGRVARLIELEPKYCDVVVLRWETFTGKKAVLEGTGVGFEQAKFGRRLGVQDTLKEEALAN